MKPFLYTALIGLSLSAVAQQPPTQQEMLLRLVVGDNEYRHELEAVNNSAHALCHSMKKAVEAMTSAQDTATAQAAVPAVLEMVQAQNALRAAIAEVEKLGITPDGLYKARRFGAHVRRMPIQAYNAQLSRLLAAECHDCTELYLALTGKHGMFSREAMEAPLSETEATTLQQLETFYQQIADYRKSLTLPEIMKQADALQAGVNALADSPRAAMKRARIEQQYQQKFHWKGPTTGDFEKRFILEPDTFPADIFTAEYRKRYFSMRAADRNKTPDAARLQKEALSRHRETYEAAREKYCLGTEDGLTPQTAMHLKNARRDTCTEVINNFSREAFGADYVFSDPEWGRTTDMRGRTIIRALALAGRSSHKSATQDTPYILLEIYFYAPRY